METTIEFTGTLSEQIEAISTAQPQPASAFAEVLGRKVQSVKGALSKLVEAGTLSTVEVEGEPTTYRVPKRERANYGYQRDTSQGANATKRSEALRKVLEAAEGSLSKGEVTDRLSELEGAPVTPRAVYHAIWRHSIKRHEDGQDVVWPFIRQTGSGAKVRYELDAAYEASNRQVDDEPTEGEADAA